VERLFGSEEGDQDRMEVEEIAGCRGAVGMTRTWRAREEIEQHFFALSRMSEDEATSTKAAQKGLCHGAGETGCDDGVEGVATSQQDIRCGF
jgi:hypothetical protein